METDFPFLFFLFIIFFGSLCSPAPSPQKFGDFVCGEGWMYTGYYLGHSKNCQFLQLWIANLGIRTVIAHLTLFLTNKSDFFVLSPCEAVRRFVQSLRRQTSFLHLAQVWFKITLRNGSYIAKPSILPQTLLETVRSVCIKRDYRRRLVRHVCSFVS